jgi:putative transposase
MFVRWSGSRRWLWNYALHEWIIPIANLRSAEKAVPANLGKPTSKYPSSFDMMSRLPALKKLYPWLSLVPGHSLQCVISDLSNALLHVATGSGFPKPKKKGGCSDSFRIGDNKIFSIDQKNSRVKIPKIGWIKYFNSRLFSGTPKTLTVIRKQNHWYISIQVELPESANPPLHPYPDRVVGIDRGVAVLLTLSDGSTVGSLTPILKGLNRELKIAQRSASRKKKGGKNWRKAINKVSSIYARIARIRRDYLHKASTTIAKTHGVVVLEDLNTQAMTGSAAGTASEPGKNVKAKTGLNRAILEQGWSIFEGMLRYKIEGLGGRLLSVPAAYTSQRCSACGHTAAANRKSQAKFVCVLCGYAENADINAAKNIKMAGQAILGESPEGEYQPQQRRAHKPTRRSVERK